MRFAQIFSFGLLRPLHTVASIGIMVADTVLNEGNRRPCRVIHPRLGWSPFLAARIEVACFIRESQANSPLLSRVYS